ncbi:MAG: nucleotidyltransferase domain-containing protein [Actinobacteria bacterium]|nr:nucleotidyltransferase domain-containing protein [Actinomycetota bacterium]
MGIIENIYKEKDRIQEKNIKAAFMDALNISKILVNKFGAKEVVLYGSLLKKKYFDSASDIDLAVKGLEDNYFKAYGYCLRNSEFNLDIKAYEDLPEKFKNIVDKRGIKLYEQKS